MTVIPGHFDLSDEQKRFVSLLNRWPDLLPYWDFGTHECQCAALENRMGTMSHGERIMASFFMDLWLNDGAKRFDLIEAQCVLDESAFAIIQAWVDDPFIP